jgi:hypothetical protein
MRVIGRKQIKSNLQAIHKQLIFLVEISVDTHGALEVRKAG